MKFTYAEANGTLMMTDGFGPVLRWDGKSPQAVEAGIAPPSTAPTVSGSGRGGIAGTYDAYVRFKDDQGRISDLSPVSEEYIAQSDTGTVTDATAATPVVITTDADHGLTTGDTVEISGVGGNVDANGVFSVTVLSSTTFELDDSSSESAYTGGGEWISGVETITYTNVPVSSDPKVTIRQILRNTAGQTDEYYVDVETTDLAGTTFTSTRNDEELSTQEAQALLDDLRNDLANVHAVPPATKLALVHHQDRMFYLGEEDYVAGSCKVEAGSTTVYGVGTDWKEAFAARELHVDGGSVTYTISSVDEDAQTLTLTTGYQDATDNFAAYAIRSNSFEAKHVAFSEAGLPESVPARNVLEIRQNGDQIRGGYASGPYVYVVEQRHVHRIAFGEDPLRDGGIFPASERGCLNQQSWSLVEDKAYMIDEQGCHVFDSNGDQPIGAEVQEVFRPNSKSIWRINWKARRHFHSVLFEQQDTVRWFVCLGGCSRPFHALAYNFRLQRWWIEQYPRPITASCVGRLNGVPTVFLGSDARTVGAYWQGTMDFLDSSAAGTKRGTATSWTLTSLSDSTAAFEASAVGATVHIVDGTGRGQARRVVERTTAKLTVQHPWLIMPDATSVYQLGGVQWVWRSKRFRLSESNTTKSTGLSLLFEPTENDATIGVQVHRDFNRSPVNWKTPTSSQAGNQLRTDADKPHFVIDTSKELGHVNKSFPRKRAGGFDGPRYNTVELSGVTNDEPITVYELTLRDMA